MTFKRLVLYVLMISAVLAVIGLYVLPDPPEPVAPISEKWERSPHNAADSESFTRWDEDDPPRVPVACAKCHSSFGYRDYLGVDGTAAGTVDQAAKTGTTVNCSACHNPAAHVMTEVAFPSGAVIDRLGSSAVCAQCHQGRSSTSDVEEATAGLDDDTVSEDLAFINVHYAIAAATWLGSEVQGGYEYADRAYVGRYEHVPDLQTCTDCHDPHGLSVPADSCRPCHVNVVDRADLAAIRTSDQDFDGDGEVEGLASEIGGMQERLYQAMQTYAAEVVGTPLLYADQFPYFFTDPDGDGQAEPDELNFGNRYTTWTPRLLRAAYNYHFSHEDDGNYVHNGRYVLQILYDSTEGLGEAVTVDLAGALRPTSESY